MTAPLLSIMFWMIIVVFFEQAVNFKSHILQFSGFVWHESDVSILIIPEQE